jgi:hypothetical protein
VFRYDRLLPKWGILNTHMAVIVVSNPLHVPAPVGSTPLDAVRCFETRMAIQAHFCRVRALNPLRRAVGGPVTV